MKSTDPQASEGPNYREIAATLRQIAEKLRAGHQARERLLALAGEFDELAAATGEGQLK